MKLTHIHHISVLVADLSRALDFYINVMGLELDTSRPRMAFNGAWLTVGAQQIHLLELPNPDRTSGRPEHAGRDRHAAFTVDDLTGLEARLQAEGVAFTRSSSGRQAIFCRDPDGNGIELIAA